MCYIIKLSFFQQGLLTWPLELHSIAFSQRRNIGTYCSYTNIPENLDQLPCCDQCYVVDGYGCFSLPLLWGQRDFRPLSGHGGEAMTLAQAEHYRLFPRGGWRGTCNLSAPKTTCACKQPHPTQNSESEVVKMKTFPSSQGWMEVGSSDVNGFALWDTRRHPNCNVTLQNWWDQTFFSRIRKSEERPLTGD